MPVYHLSDAARWNCGKPRANSGLRCGSERKPDYNGSAYLFPRAAPDRSAKYAYPCSPENNVTVAGGWVVPGYIETGQENFAWFGQAVWLPGDVARTYNNGYTANFVGLVTNAKEPTAEEIAELHDCVEKNCKLEIKLLHVPSGKYIMDKTITLQG